MSMLGDLMGPSDPKPSDSPSPSGNSCATCKKPMPSTPPVEPSENAKKFAEKFRNLKPRMSNNGN